LLERFDDLACALARLEQPALALPALLCVQDAVEIEAHSAAQGVRSLLEEGLPELRQGHGKRTVDAPPPRRAAARAVQAGPIHATLFRDPADRKTTEPKHDDPLLTLGSLPPRETTTHRHSVT